MAHVTFKSGVFETDGTVTDDFPCHYKRVEGHIGDPDPVANAEGHIGDPDPVAKV